MSAQDLQDQMMRTGRINLCLSRMPKQEWQAARVLCPNLGERDRYKITDGCSEGLHFRPYAVKKSQGYGWYGRPYPIFDVWFVGPDGYEWYGRSMGYTEWLPCRRLKSQSLSWRRYVWVCKDGRAIPLDQMERTHIEHCIAKINRSTFWRKDYLPHLCRALEYVR